MALISVPGITDGTTIDAADVNLPINTIVNEINGNIDSANIAAGSVGTSELQDGAVTTVKLASNSVAPSKGYDLVEGVRYQANATNSTLSNQLIQCGWGFVLGNGTTFVQDAVTFPTPFDDTPIVMVNAMGMKDGVDPTSIAELDDNGYGDVTFANALHITPSGFAPSLKNVFSNSTGSWRIGYTWIAIGTKAR